MVTFLHVVFFRDKLECQGTSLHAYLATSTFFLDDENDAIGAFIDSRFRAGFNAGRLTQCLQAMGT